MKLTFIIFSVFIFSCCFTTAKAQPITDTLQETKIKRKKKAINDIKINEYAPGQKVKTIDSLAIQIYNLQNLSDLLTQQEPIFVKSYGFNQLATLSFRGASAAQSMVLWNGVPIQNAALGMADVSSLPILLINKINLVYGGSGVLLGSGNVGGAVMLENDETRFDSSKKSLAVFSGYGSYGQYSSGLQTHFSFKKWYFKANILSQNAINNFRYTNQTGQSTYIYNSKLNGVASTLMAAYKINSNQTISFSGWLQQYYREIPPALFENNSDKNTLNQSFRLLADWKRSTYNTEWYAKACFIKDEIIYKDTSIGLQTNYTPFQYYQELGWNKHIDEFSKLLIFLPIQIAWMHIPNTNSTQQQNKTGIAGAYELNFLNNKLQVATNAREEVINSKNIFLVGADASYRINNWLQIRGNVQQTYRTPSLDELYFFPGGNSNLKPEQGWGQDAGYLVQFHIGKFNLSQDASIFNREIKDWIIWLGGAIWTPHNIAEVQSRGTETENKISYNLGDYIIHLNINTAYILSTTISSYIPNDGSIGKQIPYTPRYNFRFNLGFDYKNCTLNYNHAYTGYRFITSDETEYLLPYQTGNLQFLFRTRFQKSPILFNAQSNNIWNEKYQVVNGRPMPGINYLMGIKLGILQ